MTLRRMIDAAYLPTDPAQLQMVRNLTGASVAVVYIPGWGKPDHSTPVAQAKMLSQQGMLLLPFLVPAPDGGDITEAEAAVGIDVAVKYMQEVGTTGTLIGVDFEAKWFAAKPGPVCNSQVEFVLARKNAGMKGEYARPLDGAAGAYSVPLYSITCPVVGAVAETATP